MPRKMRPFVIAGRSVDLCARGFKLIRGESYWLPSSEAALRGYTPRSVRLHFDLSFDSRADAIHVTGKIHELRRLATWCEKQWLDMTEWLSSPDVQAIPIFDGTLESLIKCFQTDKESSYFTVRQNTQRCYDDWCRTLARAAGQRRVDHLDGRFFRRLFREILAPAEAGGRPRVRLANACVKQMMPILLAYGVEIGLRCCIELRDILENIVLRVPDETRAEWNAKKPQRLVMGSAHAEAFVDEGIRRGTRRSLSMAIGVAAQFELTLAQIDVIGWWEKNPAVRELPPNAIMVDGELWHPGLCYEDFLPDMQLDIRRSKNGRGGVFDLEEYPLFMKALAAIPAEWRTGPVAIDEHGYPFFGRRAYTRAYREIADAAGVPQEVWNMLARHGGLTEADNAGAELSDISTHAQHANTSTTKKHYIKPTAEPTRRVARARVQHRQKKESA